MLLADGDYATASDGKKPVAAVGGMRTIDPLRPVALRKSGPSLGAIGAPAYVPQRALIAAFAALAVTASAVTPEIVLTPCCSVP